MTMTDSERSGLTDELMAVRCQLGESDAFDDLVERWHEPLWRYLRRMAGSDDEAAETLQDAWLRILRGLPGLRRPDRLRAWLFGIARRALMDRLRHRYATTTDDDVDLDDIPAEPIEEPIDDLDTMHEELAAMPLVEREVLVLFYLRELPLDQAADVLGVPVGTVKSRLYRARRMLRDRLQNRGFRND